MEPKVLPIQELPPFAQDCVARLWKKHGNPTGKDVVVTYFDAIYTRNPLPQHLFIHECVHFVRQGSGQDEEKAKEWCERYVTDEKFRLEEELLAYKEQYKFILRKTNKPVAFEHAKSLAKDLSSEMYSNMISYTDALFAIIHK